MVSKMVGVLLLVILVVVSYWSWPHRASAPAPSQEHALMGSSTPEGDYAYREDKPYYTINVRYPRGRLSIEQALAVKIAQFKADYKLDALTAEDVAVQNLGSSRKYEFVAEYKTFLGSTTTSYVFMIYEDTLGAHPNYYYQSFVFDQNGDNVALPQLWPNNPNWLEELSLLVSNDVVAQYKKRAQVDDVTGLVYAEGLAPKLENFQNFAIDGQTLVIFIPPYQVAAYAAGNFEVRIPLAALSR